MATYYAQPICDGWVEVEVEAENIEEAREKMAEILEEMDFGCLRDVAWDLYDTEIEGDGVEDGDDDDDDEDD